MEKDVIYEKSCGVIPFRRVGDRVEFLLLHSAMVRNPDAAWEFPKGSLEEGESEQEAALRELGEETCLTNVELLPQFRDQVHYTYRRRGQHMDKTVVFFLGEVKAWDKLPSDPPSHEHCDHPVDGIWHTWLAESETMTKLFHPGMRGLFSRATFFFHEHERIRRRTSESGSPSPTSR